MKTRIATILGFSILLFAQAAFCEPLWVQDNSLVNGMTFPQRPGWQAKSPSVVYDLKGDGKWVGIYGANNGSFWGFHWEGSNWVADSSVVNGLPAFGLNNTVNASIRHDFDQNGRWTLLTGASDDLIHGFYWDGMQWVEDAALTNGITPVGNGYACTRLTYDYDITGRDRWEIIEFDGNGIPYGWYWNGSQWVGDSSIVRGLSRNLPTPYGSTWGINPDYAYNLFGDGGRYLILGEYYGGLYGYRYDMDISTWVYEDWITEGLINIGSGSCPDLVYDFAANGTWTLFGGSNSADVTAFTLEQTPVPEPATMLLLGSGLIGFAGFRRKFRKK